MAANVISGPHGRDISAAETGANQPARNKPLDQTTFGDVLDVLNPMQYLPVVGTIYRACTGDQGSPGLRTAVSLLGGALTGGPVGLLTSMAGELFQRFFPIEQTVRAMLGVGPKPASTAATGIVAPSSAATPSPAGRTASAASASPTAAPPIPPLPTPALPTPAPGVARTAVAAYAQADAINPRLIWGGREG